MRPRAFPGGSAGWTRPAAGNPGHRDPAGALPGGRGGPGAPGRPRHARLDRLRRPVRARPGAGPDLARDGSAAGRRQSALGHQRRAGLPGGRPRPAAVERQGPARPGGADRLVEFRRGRGGLAQAGPRAGGGVADDRDPVQDLGGARHPAIRPPRRPADGGCLDPSDRCGAMVRRGGRRLPFPRHDRRGGTGRRNSVPRDGVPVFAGLGASEPSGCWVLPAAG